jgi:hypothetical protein
MGCASVRVLADFEGRWQLSRRILHADGPVATLEGRAIWTRAGASLIQSEEGELRMPGLAPLRATRAYRWDEGLDVHFEDGRFFHRVPAAGGSTRHDCDPDTYDVTYDFTDWPVFTVTWDVRGPRKAYHMVSRYTRI